MTELLQLAIKSNRVSIPVEGYERSIILFQIVVLSEDDGMLTALILTKDTKEKDRKDILIAGYSALSEKITTLNNKQIIQVLDELKKYSVEDLSKTGLSIEDIEKAKVNLINFNMTDTKEPICLFLSEHISAFYNKTAQDYKVWDIDIFFNDKLLIKPESFSFISTYGSNDVLSFTFNFNKIDLSELRSLHLLDDIKIFIDAGMGRHQEYSAVCSKINIINDKVIVNLEPAGLYIMKKSKIKTLFIEKADVKNIFYFIARSSGLPKENIMIEGFKNEIKNIYTIIIPIQNIDLKNDSVGIGNVTFYPFSLIDEDIEKFIDNIRNGNEKIDRLCWAKIHIEENNPYDAYVLAKQQIMRSLDLLMHVVRSDSILINYSTEHTLINWDKDYLIPKPQVTTWVYIQNAFTGETIITDIERLMMPNQLVIKEDLIKKLDNIEWYEEMLLELSFNKNKSIEPLFNALKWSKKSWDSEDNDDEILYSIIALEFVVSGEKADPIIPKEYHDKLIKDSIDAFSKDFYGEEINKKQYEEKLKEKFAQALTDAPLFVKLDNLIERLSIPIREQDIQLLKKARRIRNDLVHGRESSVLTKDEIWKVNSIVNLIIAHKLFSLKGE